MPEHRTATVDPKQLRDAAESHVLLAGRDGSDGSDWITVVVVWNSRTVVYIRKYRNSVICDSNASYWSK